jgi:anthranilate synthase component I
VGARCGFGALRSHLIPEFSAFEKLCKPGRAVPLKLSYGHSRAFLFESVEGGERIGRWSFLGAGPKETYSYRLGEGQDPFTYADQYLKKYRAMRLPQVPRFTGGLVGHLSYDVIRLLEPKIPISGLDETAPSSHSTI